MSLRIVNVMATEEKIHWKCERCCYREKTAYAETIPTEPIMTDEERQLYDRCSRMQTTLFKYIGNLESIKLRLIRPPPGDMSREDDENGESD